MTPQSHRNGGIQNGNHRCPSLARIPKLLRVTAVGLTAVALTFSHTYEYRTYRYSVCFPPRSLCFYLTFSDSVTYQHRSTGHDLSLRQQKDRGGERERPRDGAEWQFYSADAETFRVVPLYQRDSNMFSTC